MSGIRHFGSGATRDQDTTKHDYEGFLSPLVIERFGEYMTKHRIQPDGEVRNSDNWQLGIPLSAYIKSMFRHFHAVWKEYRGVQTPEGQEDNLCALMFNVMGYLHEVLKERGYLNEFQMEKVVLYTGQSPESQGSKLEGSKQIARPTPIDIHKGLVGPLRISSESGEAIKNR